MHAYDSDSGGFEDLARSKYCLLTTFRKTGAAVQTPVWFAVAGTRVYVKTETPSGKVKRVRREPRARIAPCTVRGRPLGPAFETRARVLAADEEAHAEAVLQRRYGAGRRLFVWLVEPFLHRGGRAPAYLELVPAATDPR